jgi:uncharacterized protein DUF6703
VTPPENLLRRLARVNPTQAFIAAIVLLLAGLFLPGIIGAAVLFVLGAALVTLTYLTWPVQSPSTRTFRVLLLGLLFLAVLLKAFQ